MVDRVVLRTRYTYSLGSKRFFHTLGQWYSHATNSTAWRIVTGHFHRSALLTLVLNPLARLLTGSRLDSRELATVYIMMIVAAAIPSWGFVMNLIPFLGGLFYYATPENDWSHSIHPYVADWLVTQDRTAIWKLFEGAARGEPVPWILWLKPL